MSAATIMVVEDNPLTRKMVRFALETRGHSVIEAADAASALSVLGGREVDLILQDLVLPDMDGFDLVTRLRALPNGGVASILAFSGLLSKVDEARIATLGFDDLVVKPIEPSRLVPLIEAHLLGPTNRDRIGRGRRLVLADDDPLQLKLTLFRLERLGFRVEAVADGQEALEAAKREPPDGIVSDVLMPRLDGFGLALAVRSDPVLCHIPVLLVTSSYVDDSDKTLARDAGASDLVVRTPDQRELTVALRNLLEDRPSGWNALPRSHVRHVERERSGRVVHQLERQVTLNSGLAHRCSTLAAELAVLGGISEAVVKHQNLELALDETLAACLDVGGLAAGALYLLQDDGSFDARPFHRHGELAGLSTFFGEEEQLRAVLSSQRSVLIPSRGVDPAWSDSLLGQCNADFAFAIPLVQGDRAIGVFFLAIRGDEASQDDWRVFAQGIGNQIVGSIALARTFDAKETAERLAQEQTLLLELILDSMGEAVIATDVDGKVLRMNRVASTLTEWPESLGLHRPLGEVVALLDERSRDPLPVLGGPDWGGQTHADGSRRALLVARSGSERPVALRDAPIRNRDGSVRGTALVFRDISESRSAEQALRRSEELFRATFEQAAVGMARLSADGRWLDINDRLSQILGYRRDELLGHASEDVTHPDDWAADASNLGEVLAGRSASFSLEKRYVRPDGGVAWAEVTTSLVRTASGLPDYFIAVVQDISARKRAEAELELTASQLRQSQKMETIGQLAGGVAHDFNNLLSVIRGHSELLLEDLAAGDPVREEVEEIAYACERACNLTRQLLVLSRKQVVAPSVVDVNQVTEALSKMMRRLIGEDIEVSLDLGATAHAQVDPGQLEQALINLVVNARDAMPNGGKLLISTRDQPARPGAEPPARAQVIISVTDTGTGIPPEALQQIFEPFFTTKPAGKGTGLGLSTVLGIVKQNGGEISVTTDVNQGTTFSIALPVADGSRRFSSSPSPESSPTQATETVLLVEDEGQVRSIAKAILERAGYHVLAAATCDEALAISGEPSTVIHLLVTDVVMPDMNGRQLAERVLAQRPDLKVVYMSGYTDDAILHHGVLRDGVAFVQKPLTVASLLGKIREALKD
jgi:two-component system, cell cycle sensor histidine kinase and response regulator CckA